MFSISINKIYNSIPAFPQKTTLNKKIIKYFFKICFVKLMQNVTSFQEKKKHDFIAASKENCNIFFCFLCFAMCNFIKKRTSSSKYLGYKPMNIRNSIIKLYYNFLNKYVHSYAE